MAVERNPLADMILNEDDTLYEDVVVPEWGNRKIRLRGMTGDERDRWEGSMRQYRPTPDKKGMEVVIVSDNSRAKLLVKCIVDEEGKRVFRDTDAGALGDKNGAALDRLFEVAQRLSGISEGDMEMLVGNSESAPSDGSTSDSPANSE